MRRKPIKWGQRATRFFDWLKRTGERINWWGRENPRKMAKELEALERLPENQRTPAQTVRLIDLRAKLGGKIIKRRKKSE